MLVMVADSDSVKAASEDPPLPDGTDSGNETAPPPEVYPAPPTEEPQRVVEPGTITQGWDQSSLISQIVDRPSPTLVDSNGQLVYETAYGNFALNKSVPYFIGVSGPGPDPQKIADSAFLVLFEGQLLSPAKGGFDNATSDELSFHYGLYLNANLKGTMTIRYLFDSGRNKITISFSPSAGKPDEYQIVWLTFTTRDAVDTAAYPEGTERFEEVTQGYGLLSFGDTGTLYGTGGYTRDGIPGAAIREDKVGSGLSLQLDVTDA